MPPRSKEAQRRHNRNRGQRERALEAAKKAASKPPVITEADLLAFQLAHFGDGTCSDNWFIDAQVALAYDPALDLDLWEEEDDGLGYYEDGVKRTLTDEQIEMFRHSEWQEIAREERLAREEQGSDDGDDTVARDQQAPASPLSDASSMDEDLVGLATTAIAKPGNGPSPSPAMSRSETPTLPVPAFTSTKRSNSISIKRPGISKSSKDPHPKKKFRKEEVPYEQRNKRKWEEHIATVQMVKGTWMYDSKTENRVLREMDDVKAEEVELDY